MKVFFYAEKLKSVFCRFPVLRSDALKNLIKYFEKLRKKLQELTKWIASINKYKAFSSEELWQIFCLNFRPFLRKQRNGIIWQQHGMFAVDFHGLTGEPEGNCNRTIKGNSNEIKKIVQ